MKIPGLFLIYTFFAAAAVFSQSRIPVVSNISAAVDDNMVILSWKAPAEPAHIYRIYRSAEPLSRQTIVSAELISTLPGTSISYTDILPDTKEYYYAVLIQQADGTIEESIIPSFNTTITPVSAAEIFQSPEPAHITSLNAIVKDEAVIITYASFPKNKRLVLYRSTSPFTDMTSLTSAVIAETFIDNGTPYIDYPIPEVGYYYALVDEDTIRSGTVAFKNGVNATGFPVSVLSGKTGMAVQDKQTIRPIPLPYLNMTNEPEDRSAILSAETREMIKKLTENVMENKPEFLEPYIFPVDRRSESRGEEYTLRTILNDSFVKGSWEAAIESLNTFLSIRRTAETTARANFYLGEAYYFTGRYQDALFKFLLAQDTYNTQSRKWIQDTLSKLSG